MLENWTRTVQIGKLSITLPALVTAICGLVIGGLTMILRYKELSNPFVLGGILMIPLVFLYSAYIVNCTIVGHCNTVAVVLSFLYVLYTIILMGAVLMKFLK